jgi:RNA polymerase sigma-70 factor, ECF subfamily
VAATDSQFAGFCGAHHERLVGSLGLYVGDRAVAEELAQEALARAWARWAKVREMDDPVGWVYRVGFNLANSYWRRRLVERRARHRLLPDAADNIVDDLTTAVMIREAISQLSRRKRTVLLLRYFVDMPYADIAEVMNAPESTVKSLARRALEDLRRQLPQDVQKEPDYVS